MDIRSDKEYKIFLRGILQKGRLSEAYIDHLLDNYLANFKTALTHNSISENVLESLEYYETAGDTVVNLGISWWTVLYHPEIVNIDFFAKTKHALAGTGYLGKIGIKLGFEAFVLVNENDMKIFDDVEEYSRKKGRDISRQDVWEYVKIYEDAVEAFFGCLVKTMVEDGHSFGAAIEIAFTIIVWMIEDVLVQSVNYEDIYDPSSLLRDLYQNKENGLRWVVKEGWMKEIERDDEGPLPMQRVKIYHWDQVKPLSDPYAELSSEYLEKYFSKSNRKILYISPWIYGEDEKGVKQEASKEALKLLAKGEDYLGNKLSKKYAIKTKVNPCNSRRSWEGFFKSKKGKFRSEQCVPQKPRRTYYREENRPQTSVPSKPSKPPTKEWFNI
jgi:dsRNA-specific ribonuclease